jgi:hypothetical protein
VNHLVVRLKESAVQRIVKQEFSTYWDLVSRLCGNDKKYNIQT